MPKQRDPMTEMPYRPSQTAKVALLFGILGSFSAVLLGAFGAHMLKSMLPLEALAIWQTAVFYHVFHALALIALALYTKGQTNGLRHLKIVAVFMIAGIALFSGSLYLLALTHLRVFGAITPVGGICFLAAWLAWAVHAYRSF